jgi:hypothetical protein
MDVVRLEAFDVLRKSLLIVEHYCAEIRRRPESPVTPNVWTIGVVFAQILEFFPTAHTGHGELRGRSLRLRWRCNCHGVGNYRMCGR